MRATYYISFNGADYTQIYPSNVPKVTLTREPGEIFFRWRVDLFRIGAKLNDATYTILLHYFFDSVHFTDNIYYRIKENDVTTYEFIDPIAKGKINTQNSVFECSPDPDDTYRSVLYQYDIKWQDRTADKLFGKSDIFNVSTLNTAYFVNVDFTSFVADVDHTISYTNTSGLSQYARNELDVISSNGDMILVFIRSRSITGANPTIQLVDALNNTYSNVETVTANGKYILTQTGAPANVYLSIQQTDIIFGSSGSFEYTIYYPLSHTSGSSLKTLLGAVINGASYMNLSISTIYSTILWNDALETDAPASIDTYITANPANDYVIEAVAIYNKLWVSRTDRFTTEKEVTIETSLKDIMDMLKKIRMWWFIDSDGHFRIEHDKYFRSYDAQLDITDPAYTKYKSEADAKIYNYDRENSYTQINYSENNEYNGDFVAYPVLYLDTLLTSNVKDVRFAGLTTDVQRLIDSPGDADSSGLLLLRTIGAINLVDVDESVLVANTYYQNLKLAWSWLFVNYYKYFAEASAGTINDGTAINYTAVKEFLQQDGIKVYFASAVNWKKPITTALGTGWIRDYEYNPETGFHNINVGYDPYV